MLRLMDQLVAGVAIAAQQTIHRELPAGFAGVIIGDDDLLIFAACRLGHAVGTGGAEDGLDDEGKLEMAGAKGAVILSKSEMTAMEMVRTILALTDRAGQLMRELTERCGSCEGCAEGHCTFRDADIEELIRPAVTVPDWAREEADIAPDAKLDCHVDEGSGVITVCETFYDHDLSDIPAELLEALRKSGCCLSVLEDMLMDDDVIYDK